MERYLGLCFAIGNQSRLSGLVFLEIVSNLELSIYVSLINSFQSRLPIKADSVYRASATHAMSFLAIVLLLNNASFSLLSFFISCLTANSHSVHFCLNMKSASRYKYQQKVSSLHHNLNYCEKRPNMVTFFVLLCENSLIKMRNHVQNNNPLGT